jgi:hypothetical protein
MPSALETSSVAVIPVNCNPDPTQAAPTSPPCPRTADYVVPQGLMPQHGVHAQDAYNSGPL